MDDVEATLNQAVLLVSFKQTNIRTSTMETESDY